MIIANDIVKANEVLKNVVERTPQILIATYLKNMERLFILKKKICKRYVLSNCVEPTMLSIN